MSGHSSSRSAADVTSSALPRGAVGEVIVVEHQIDVDRLGADLIDQCRQQAVCRWVTGLKQRLKSTTHVRQHGLKRCDDV